MYINQYRYWYATLYKWCFIPHIILEPINLSHVHSFFPSPLALWYSHSGFLMWPWMPVFSYENFSTWDVSSCVLPQVNTYETFISRLNCHFLGETFLSSLPRQIYNTVWSMYLSFMVAETNVLLHFSQINWSLSFLPEE